MIDTHVHFWNFDPVRDSWITEEMGAIRRDFLPADFVEASEENGITSCIAVQADQSEAQNDFLLTLADANPVIKGIVGWIDLKNPALSDRLDHWKNFEIIKGWRHVLQAENADFILDPDFVTGLKTLTDYHYTYDLLCYHDQLPTILKLVDQVPNQPLILDHCGKPNVKDQNLKTWTANIKQLSQNPNVYCKISGLLTEADWYHWTETQIFNCFDVVFEHFGPNRICYGSDWPVVEVSRPYADWFNLVSKYVANLNQVERRAIFEDNARRFYKLS